MARRFGIATQIFRVMGRTPMNHPIRIAVHMQPTGEPPSASKFQAALPMGAFFEKSLDKQEIERARVELEQAYAELVSALRTQRAAMRTRNVMAYWHFGDLLVAFEQAHQTSLLFIEHLNEHLIRDVEFSNTMIILCRRFRLAFPDPTHIDSRQSFTNYQRAGFDSAQLASTVRQRGRPRK